MGVPHPARSGQAEDANDPGQGASASGTPSAYHVEDLAPAERARLEPWVSDVDSPVFVLRGLPQVTAAALFARYSRSPKSLRRLLLDEFLDEGADGAGAPPARDAGRARAGRLFGRVIAEYGDDSVAQLAGVHLACEQVSQPLAKAIEWGRLAAYLEQSTRYIPYTDRRDGRYRYFRDPELMASPHAGVYTAAMDGLFDAYCEMLPALREHLDRSLPPEQDARARGRALRALALDLLRGLLPAGTVSNVGVFASPQALELLVMRLRAHPLPEARAYAELIDRELQREIPELVARLDRADRGGAWVDYLRGTEAGLRAEAERLGVDGAAARRGGCGVPAGEGSGRVAAAVGARLLRWDRDGEERILAAALWPHTSRPLTEVTGWVRGLSEADRDRVFAAAVGERGNRRHRPGRGFEHAEYTFELVSDFGAFRDLQRHRLLTIQWQELTPALGSSVPPEVEAAGLGPRWRAAVEAAEEAWARIRPSFPQQAQYLVTLGHRIRYALRLNAREALHMIELRTSPQGHPSYRALCREMLREIDEVAGHHRVARAMRFAGREDVHLPRYAAEAARPGE